MDVGKEAARFFGSNKAMLPEQGKLLMIYTYNIFPATSTTVVVYTHTHTRISFSSASLFVAKKRGTKRARSWNLGGGWANSMHCIFNTNARFSLLFNASAQVHATPTATPPCSTSYANIYDDAEKRGGGCEWAMPPRWQWVGPGTKVARTVPPLFSTGRPACELTCVCVGCRPHNGMSDEALSRHNYFFCNLFHSLLVRQQSKWYSPGPPLCPQTHECISNQSSALPNQRTRSNVSVWVLKRIQLREQRILDSEYYSLFSEYLLTNIKLRWGGFNLKNSKKGSKSLSLRTFLSPQNRML